MTASQDSPSGERKGKALTLCSSKVHFWIALGWGTWRGPLPPPCQQEKPTVGSKKAASQAGRRLGAVSLCFLDGDQNPCMVEGLDRRDARQREVKGHLEDTSK